MPARIKKERETVKTTTLKVSLIEGRQNQLKLMFRRIGHKVLTIRRLAIGPLSLGHMRRGQIRRLTGDELSRLKKELKTHEDR